MALNILKDLTFKATVYLAGPIGGLTWAEATDWRNNATELLRPMRCLSPLRDMDGASLRGSCFTEDRAQESNFDKVPFNKLFQRDYMDVHTCDAVFVNFIGAKKQSVGTICEIAWTYRQGKPMVVVMEPGNINENIFLDMQIHHRAHNLADGINMLRGLYGWTPYDGH